MKKKIVLIVLTAVVAVGVLTVGGTLASRNATTEGKNQTGESVIKTDALVLKLEDHSDKNKEVCLNEPIHLSYQVTNGSDQAASDYDCFTRLVLHKTWGFEGSDLEVKLVGDSADKWQVMDPLEGVDPAVREQMGIDEDCIYLYYKSMLAKGQSVTCDIDVLVKGSYSTDYKDASIVFEASAQSVQAFGADKAIPSEWGVYVALDQEGKSILGLSKEPIETKTITEISVPASDGQ